MGAVALPGRDALAISNSGAPISRGCSPPPPPPPRTRLPVRRHHGMQAAFRKPRICFRVKAQTHFKIWGEMSTGSHHQC